MELKRMSGFISVSLIGDVTGETALARNNGDS